MNQTSAPLVGVECAFTELSDCISVRAVDVSDASFGWQRMVRPTEIEREEGKNLVEFALSVSKFIPSQIKSIFLFFHIRI